MEKLLAGDNCADPKIGFYKRALDVLNGSGIPYLVGGAYSLYHITGIYRDTKDLDIFIRAEDRTRTLNLFAEEGFETSITFPHWLAKVVSEGYLVDIIFNSGNAISEVDEQWFQYAEEGKVLGVPVRFVPAEEMIWSKGFIMERERFDGADVNHILLARGASLDWKRLLDRFSSHWRILFSHLVLFGFVYPSERNLVPEWVMRELMARLEPELANAPAERVCRGTLISRAQYKIDVDEHGFEDSRLIPNGKMTKKQISKWDKGAMIDGLLKRVH
ncbi:MAG: nucleotidyltransferase [Syntrophobacteraceae bacterium]